MDSDGDGIGDLRGIIAKLPVLKELGIGIIWLSPVYCTANEDNGYDISDYKAINPEFGTMADMDALLDRARELDIKIVMDLVINHTSHQHEWFKLSCQGVEPYRDYYIWRNKPNNWTGFFGEGCWEYCPQRGQYYLHLFAKGQPDLNYRCPQVLDEVKSIMRFWLDKGVAGFRCDVINILYKSSLNNGFPSLALTGREHYISQQGTHSILKELRRTVLNDYDCFTVGETVFVTPKQARQLCNNELDMVFAFEHMEVDCFFVKWLLRGFKPKRFFKALAKWQKKLDWNTVYFENHDQPRIVSRLLADEDCRLGASAAKAAAVLLLTLRGTPFIYQGQELGMTNFDFTNINEIQDVESHNIYRLAKRLHLPQSYRWKMLKQKSRDNARTPYQWDSSKNAGFTTGTPWLGVNSNHITYNINFKEQHCDENSVWQFYKRLIEYRNGCDILKHGKFILRRIYGTVLTFEREYKGNRLGIVVNLGAKPHSVPSVGECIISTHGRKILDCQLEPFEACIVKR